MDPVTIVAVVIGLVVLGGAVAAVSFIRDNTPAPPEDPNAAAPPTPPTPAKPAAPKPPATPKPAVPRPPTAEMVDVTREAFTPGTAIVIESIGPVPPRKVVFEDDGKSGYVSAVDPRRDPPVQDTGQVYDVASLPERKPSQVRMRWTGDGSRVIVLVDDVPQALVNFDTCSLSCRSGSPQPKNRWTRPEWDDGRATPFLK